MADISIVLAELDAVLPATRAGALKGLAQWGEKAVRLAQAYVPVDTGRLHDSITYLTDPVDLSVEVMAGDEANGVDYAAYVEFGTSRMPGRFFLTRAVAETEADAAIEAAGGINDALAARFGGG